MFVGLLAGVIGSWYDIKTNQAVTQLLVTNTQKAVDELNADVEKNKAEGITELRELRAQLEGALVKGARLETQIETLTGLVTELRGTISALRSGNSSPAYGSQGKRSPGLLLPGQGGDLQ
jgi:hypothetical protein